METHSNKSFGIFIITWISLVISSLQREQNLQEAKPQFCIYRNPLNTHPSHAEWYLNLSKHLATIHPCNKPAVK